MTAGGQISNDGDTDGGVVPALDMAAFFLSTNTNRWNLHTVNGTKIKNFTLKRMLCACIGLR